MDKFVEFYDGVDMSKLYDGVFELKFGDVVVVKFIGDDKWVRVIVIAKRVGDKFVSVFYCDFGNVEDIGFNCF